MILQLLTSGIVPFHSVSNQYGPFYILCMVYLLLWVQCKFIGDEMEEEFILPLNDISFHKDVWKMIKTVALVSWDLAEVIWIQLLFLLLTVKLKLMCLVRGKTLTTLSHAFHYLTTVRFILADSNGNRWQELTLLSNKVWNCWFDWSQCHVHDKFKYSWAKTWVSRFLHAFY